MLEIRNLHASAGEKPILRGISLTVNAGEVHAVMGPNGSGKSTLAQVLAGHPAYEVTAGEVLYDGENLLEMDPEERAQKGVFLAFQYPVEIPGVSNAYFLRSAFNEILQMAVLDPRLAILDETDSGLDIDALRIVAEGVNSMRRPDNATIVVTHYQRLLNYIVPDFVHVLASGRIVKSGGKELALELEARGYEGIGAPAARGNGDDPSLRSGQAGNGAAGQ